VTNQSTSLRTLPDVPNDVVRVDDVHDGAADDSKIAVSTSVVGPDSVMGGDVQNQRSQRPHASTSHSRKGRNSITKLKAGRRALWLDSRDPDGCTPLHCAASAGNSIAAQLLIDAGADVDASDIDGATALHKACAHAHITTILVLLRAGAARDAVDNAHRAPLHYAVDDDCVDALDALLTVDSAILPLSPRQQQSGDGSGARSMLRGDAMARHQLAALDSSGMSIVHRVARCGARRCLTALVC
jgi:hypothetical protein